jgi:hypothetical protein
MRIECDTSPCRITSDVWPEQIVETPDRKIQANPARHDIRQHRPSQTVLRPQITSHRRPARKNRLALICMHWIHSAGYATSTNLEAARQERSYLR